MRRKHVLIIGIMVSLLLGMMVPVMAQTATPTPQPTHTPLTANTEFFATSNYRVNVRSGPGTQYTVLGTLFSGDELDITGRLANDYWLRVNFKGQEGWVLASLFKVTGDLSSAPEAEAGATAVLRTTANQLITEKLDTVIVITRDNTNLRAAASVDADVLAVVPFGTQLTVTGRTETNNWVQVTYEDHTGWMSSGTLVFSQGNIANVAALDENGKPIPTVQPTAKPTAAP